jgi:uncharacterized protein involved in exopolysaccharide biosynthesis
MPDLIAVFARRWTFIIGLSLLCALAALAASLLRSKEYLSTATALPANTLMADKARIFNEQIESLYSEFGSSDELDRIEGAAHLDTFFVAAARRFNLAAHYQLGEGANKGYLAAQRLRKNCHISKSAYGELKISVWDTDPVLAAALANDVLRQIQELFQHLQSLATATLWKQLHTQRDSLQERYRVSAASLASLSAPEAQLVQTHEQALLAQLLKDEKLMSEYELSLKANPQVLLPVESARPAPYPDRPQVVENILFAFLAGFLFAFLAALFIEHRSRRL